MPGSVSDAGSGELIIRAAKILDVAGICVVENASFDKDAYPSFLIEKLLVDPQAIFVVLADQAGRIIGYCVSKADSTFSHLISVAVLPGHRRRGVASRMLNALLSASSQRGIREVRLEVRPDNVPAIRLYRRFGFTDVGVTPNYYSDGSAALRMRKIAS